MSIELNQVPGRLAGLVDAPMAMRPDAIQALATRIIALDDFEEPPELVAEIHKQPPVAKESKVPRLRKVQGGVAVVPVNGTIAQHRGSDYWGGVFSEELVSMVSRMVDTPNIGAVVLSFDSPGGIVYGVPEAAQAIREMSQIKPIYGYVKAEAASAAYWLAANTTKLFAQPSTAVGSIGVWMMHIDASKMLEDAGVSISLISAGKYKVEGHPFGPLEDEARAEFQGSVDRYYSDFVDGVATGRNVSSGTVRNDFGEGRMIDATRSKSLGMIDGIATLGELLAGLMEPADKGGGRNMSTQIALADALTPEM
jgi:signal peptide peptidase SppA